MYPEAAGVLSAQRWAHGFALYEDYRQPPYMTASFPPVWYGILAIAAKLGLSDLNALTLFGRLLSLACLFGVAVLGFRWNRKIGHPLGLALLTPLFYLSLPILIPWAVTARPDFPGLLLVFLALYVSSLRSTTASVFLAAALAALGFLGPAQCDCGSSGGGPLAGVVQTLEGCRHLLCNLGCGCRVRAIDWSAIKSWLAASQYLRGQIWRVRVDLCSRRARPFAGCAGSRICGRSFCFWHLWVYRSLAAAGQTLPIDLHLSNSLSWSCRPRFGGQRCSRKPLPRTHAGPGRIDSKRYGPVESSVGSGFSTGIVFDGAGSCPSSSRAGCATLGSDSQSS